MKACYSQTSCQTECVTLFCGAFAGIALTDVLQINFNATVTSNQVLHALQCCRRTCSSIPEPLNLRPAGGLLPLFGV